MILLLLPGMDGTGDLFRPLVAALGDEIEVQVVRYPPDRPLDSTELTREAAAQLPAEGSFVLLGESFSGPIAVSLAAARPPGLAGVILACSFVRSPRPWLGWLRPCVRLLPVRAAPLSVASRILLGRLETPALRAELAKALEKVSPSVLRARLEAVLSFDVTRELASISTPLLYLRATHDRVVPAASSRLVARLRPDARIVHIEGPHLLLQARPHEVVRAILALVRDVETPPGTHEQTPNP